MLHLIEHPLVQHKISMLRDKSTGTKEFRELVKETAMLMTYEATKDLPLKEVEIETPVATAKTKVISGTKLAIIPILRAGLTMAEGASELIPAARIGHIGMFRDSNTKEAVEYYAKFPVDMEMSDVLIVDPMLATANTAISAIKKIQETGCKSVKFMCIIASQQGMDALTKAFPDVDVYCGTVDPSLTEDLYINPGLGDAGDRIFGTK